MIAKIHEKLQDEDGFTLIELLVVVIIIGILAAIAIPTFLSQRERGWQSELTSVVRNVALEVEAAATNNNGNPPSGDIEDIVDTPAQFGFGADDAVTIEEYTATGSTFVLCGEHADLDGSVTYDSSVGGLQGYDPDEAC